MRGHRLLTVGMVMAAASAAAFWVASRPGPPDTSEIARLVAAIEGGTPAEREGAVSRLCNLREEGAPALPALARAWRAKPDLSLLFAMAAVAPVAPETKAALLQELTHATKEDAEVYFVFAMYPAAARGAAGEFVALLESEDEGLRGRAADALTAAEEAGIAALPLYERWLAGGKIDRERALRGIAALGESAAPAAPLVTRLLEGEDPDTVGAACVVLGAIGPGAAAAGPALARLLAEGPEEVRIAAAGALGRIDPSRREACVATLREALSSEASGFAALHCLARLGREGILALVEHGTKGDDAAAGEVPLVLMEQIRFTAEPLDALLRDPTTRAGIGSLFDRAGVPVRQLAVLVESRGALGGWVRLSLWATTVGSNMARATPLMGHEAPGASILALDGEELVTAGTDVRFGLLRSPGDPTEAARLLRTGSPIVRWLAARDLGRTKDAFAIEPLRAALLDTVPYVRAEAANAISAIEAVLR